MILVDSCILIDVLGGNSARQERSLNAVKRASITAPLAINPVICGETTVAGRAALLSRRRSRISGSWRSAGKWLGAHAEVDRLALLTRHPKDYAGFQIPEIITP